jgi:hypothetical protein
VRVCVCVLVVCVRAMEWERMKGIAAASHRTLSQ